MDVLVFTDSGQTAAAFPARGRGRVRVAGWKDFRRELESLGEQALCYLDLETLPPSRLAACLRFLRSRPQLHFAFIDPQRRLADPARAFHDGAVDYLDRAALQLGVTQARLRRVLAFALSRCAEDSPGLHLASTDGARYRLSGTDWSQVIQECEYSFFLLFIELDGKEEMEKKYGVKNLGIALSSFRSYIENAVKPANGRLWIWSGFGGLILFPFSGGESPALTCLFRLVLFRHLYDIEGSQFPNFLSLRLVLTIGNVMYSERNVGSIVSDSLNSVFHLGHDFARPGNFYLTEEVLRFSHPALKDYFLEAGCFEGRRMLRMRLPSPRAG